jgi:phage-related protein
LSEHSKDGMWHIDVAGPSVEAEILGLPPDMQARLLRILDLVQSWGPLRVGMPYTRPLMKKLWEIRLGGRDGIARVIYIAAAGRRIVLLHAFAKKTRTTPAAAIDTALRRARERGLA